VKGGHIEVVEDLLEKGAYVNLTDKVSVSGGCSRGSVGCIILVRNVTIAGKPG
jgi:hypothetical protein